MINTRFDGDILISSVFGAVYPRHIDFPLFIIISNDVVGECAIRSCYLISLSAAFWLKIRLALAKAKTFRHCYQTSTDQFT